MQQSRKYFVGGNWKSNNTVEKTKQIVEQVVNKLSFDSTKTGKECGCIPNLSPCSSCVALQNVSKYGQGAYTGEISVDHLIDMGIRWVILGHSERRNLPDIHESDTLIAEKAALCLFKGVQVIYCIGELLEERETNATFEVLTKQLVALKSKVSDWTNIVIAYEPVWAIGTGKTATPDQAQEVHFFIRGWIRDEVNEETAHKTRIIYGGSVTKDNCKILIGQPDVDGFLVGGASLKEDFITIVESTN